MNEEMLKKFEGHLVKIFCIGSILWTGRVLKIYDDSLLIRDKFSKEVIVSFSSIQNIQDLGVGF